MQNKDIRESSSITHRHKFSTLCSWWLTYLHMNNIESCSVPAVVGFTLHVVRSKTSQIEVILGENGSLVEAVVQSGVVPTIKIRILKLKTNYLKRFHTSYYFYRLTKTLTLSKFLYSKPLKARTKGSTFKIKCLLLFVRSTTHK